MNSGYDPNHQYEDWEADYDGGLLDGFCDGSEYTWPNCPTYTYVQGTDVAPYFAIASTYGFANYMFQTNEGPSFEAHQILFTGTAAPVAPNDPNNYYWDFVKNNAVFMASGCTDNGTSLGWIQPDRTNVSSQLMYECYAHDSLVTGPTTCNGNCDKGVSWRYYTPSSGIIWDAPEAIPEVCYGENDLTHAGSLCGSVGSEWAHVKISSQFDGAPIFTDINSCALQKISWVIPDQDWSDHPLSGYYGIALGPAWVANIVNAIGNSYVNSGGLCDYWGTHTGTSVEPTAILIVWDDWGGFYDHIKPPAYNTGSYDTQTKKWSCGAPNSWGCGYTYGLRVPFLVVSEYTGTLSNGNYSGYISGECGVAPYPNCPNSNFPFVHDFGSILAFTENNFGLKNIDQSGNNGYADRNALDASGSYIPLSDFFQLYNGSGSGRPFVQIPAGNDPPGFFQDYYQTHNATGPDTD